MLLLSSLVVVVVVVVLLLLMIIIIIMISSSSSSSSSSNSTVCMESCLADSADLALDHRPTHPAASSPVRQLMKWLFCFWEIYWIGRCAVFHKELTKEINWFMNIYYNMDT